MEKEYNIEYVKSYKEAIELYKKILLDHIKKENVIVYDYIGLDYKSYLRETKKVNFSSGLSIFIANFTIRLSDKLFIIEIKPESSSRKMSTKNKNSLVIYVKEENEYNLYSKIYNKKSEDLTLDEKKYILEELKKIDPLNIERLKLFLEEFNMRDIEVEKYLMYINKQKHRNNYGKSKYVEVYELIKELNVLKLNKNEQAYKKLLLFSYELFNKYFFSDFIYGIIILGSTIYSLLANLEEIEKAEDVYYKLKMFLNVEYEETTKEIIEKYKKTIQIKSTSIFTLDEYNYYFEDLKLDEKSKEYFVYNNNLAAKHLEKGLYEKAYEYIKLIDGIDTNYKNTEGVPYQSIKYNNKLISLYFSNKKIKNEDFKKFKKIKDEHIIFELNYYAFKILEEEYSGEIIISNKHKLNSDFYSFHYNVLNILSSYKKTGKVLDVLTNLNIPKIYKKDDIYNTFDELLKKLKENKEYKEILNFLNENKVKILYIDFNIWDY